MIYILCAGFIWTTRRARIILLDENIGTSARFYVYITEKSHTKNVMYFLDRGCVHTLRHLYGYATVFQPPIERVQLTAVFTSGVTREGGGGRADRPG